MRESVTKRSQTHLRSNITDIKRPGGERKMQEDDGVITRFHLSFPTVKEMTQFNPQFVPPSIKSAIYLALAQSVFVL